VQFLPQNTPFCTSNFQKFPGNTPDPRRGRRPPYRYVATKHGACASFIAPILTPSAVYAYRLMLYKR